MNPSGHTTMSWRIFSEGKNTLEWSGYYTSQGMLNNIEVKNTKTELKEFSSRFCIKRWKQISRKEFYMEMLTVINKKPSVK